MPRFTVLTETVFGWGCAAEAILTDQSQNPRPATVSDLLAICELAW